jgi:hypothetical protein
MALCPVAGSPPQGTKAQRRLERAGRTRRSILIREEVVVAPTRGSSTSIPSIKISHRSTN